MTLGCTLCQKTFTSGFPFVKKKNQGELEQYYIENSHPAIISQEIYDKVQTLLRRKRTSFSEAKRYTLSRKMICENCGAVFHRRVTANGTVIWVCARHFRNSEDCPVTAVKERDVFTTFLRVYNKLRLHEGVILRPALNQLEALEMVLRKENPAMIELNRDIALATERSYKISKLRTSGLLDADAYAAQAAANNARLAELRGKRKSLLRNDVIDENVECLRQTINAICQGPEQAVEFDEALFEELVERITVEFGRNLRFRLYGGIEVTERLAEDRK